MLQGLIEDFSKDTDFQSVTCGIAAGMKEQLISGLSGSARQIMLAALHEETQRPLLVVTHNMFSAQKMADDLQEALSPEQVLLYPANELVAAEAAVSSPETLAQRIDVLTRCAQGFRGLWSFPTPAFGGCSPLRMSWLKPSLRFRRKEPCHWMTSSCL